MKNQKLDKQYKIQSLTHGIIQLTRLPTNLMYVRLGPYQCNSHYCKTLVNSTNIVFESSFVVKMRRKPFGLSFHLSNNTRIDHHLFSYLYGSFRPHDKLKQVLMFDGLLKTALLQSTLRALAWCNQQFNRNSKKLLLYCFWYEMRYGNLFALYLTLDSISRLFGRP